MDRSLKLVTLSLLGLGLALVLPAVRVQILGAPADLSGWQAACCALGLGGQSLLNAFTQPAGQAWRYIVLGLAAVMNVAFILAPIALLRKATGEIHVRWLIGLAGFGVLLATVAPWVAENPQAHTLLGYYLWVVAYLALLSALVCHREKRKPRFAAPSSAG